MKCTCYYCITEQAHPDNVHNKFGPISHRLLKAESLDPKDSIPMEACDSCGHVREKKDNG